MSLTAMVCPQCGANIEVDKDNEHAFCMYCGSKIILKETINVVHSGTVKVENENSLDRLTTICETYSKLGNYNSLIIASNKLMEIYPDDIRGYIYKCEAITQGYTFYDDNNDFKELMHSLLHSIAVLDYENGVYYEKYYEIKKYVKENDEHCRQSRIASTISIIDVKIAERTHLLKKYRNQIIVISCIMGTFDLSFLMIAITEPNFSYFAWFIFFAIFIVIFLIRPIRKYLYYRKEVNALISKREEYTDAL